MLSPVVYKQAVTFTVFLSIFQLSESEISSNTVEQRPMCLVVVNLHSCRSFCQHPFSLKSAFFQINKLIVTRKGRTPVTGAVGGGRVVDKLPRRKS